MRTLLFFLFLIIHVHSHGQMQMGVIGDNQNVTQRIRINPAYSVDPIPYLDIELMGFYAFSASNAAYIAKEDFAPLKGIFPSSVSQNLNISNVHGQAELTILGPAANIALGKYSLNASLSFRNLAVGRNLPSEFAEAMISGLRIPRFYGDTLTGGSYRTKATSFIEFSVGGGGILYQKGKYILNGGINAKYLLGIGDLNFVADDFSYQMIDSVDAQVINYNGTYGGAHPAFHPGEGIGLDIGFSLEKKINSSQNYTPHSPKSNCQYVDYIYKVGFSVLDLGFIKFKDASYREVMGANGPWLDYNGYRTGNVDSLMANLDQIFANGITTSTSEYKSRLPLAFSFQFDYNFGNGIFVNSTLVAGIPNKKKFGAERLSVLAITPRYQGGKFGIAAPLSINSLWQPGLGLSLRFWYFTIGTDNLVPFVLDTDIYRMDVYAHIKIPIFESRPCKGKGVDKYNWKFSDCSAPGAYTPRKSKRR